MRKITQFPIAILVIALLQAMGSTVLAQVVITQSFDATTFPPTGWSLSFPGTGAIWTRPTTYFYPTCTPHSGVGTARYNSRTTSIGSTQTLVTPSFDLTDIGSDTARVSLWVYRNDSLLTAYDTLNVMLNTIADTTGAINLGTIARSIQIALPDTQPVAGWYQYTFDMPASFNGNTNYLLFRGTTRSGNNTGYRIYVDDISWDTYPAACSGAPSAGTINTVDTLVCGSGVSRLTNTGASTGQSGLAYQWQVSTVSGGPYTDFGTGATTVVSDTLTSTSYFRFLTICTVTGDTAFSNELTVVVDTNPAPVVSISPTAALYCSNSGIPALLVATGAESYTWSPTQSLSSSTTDSVYATPNFSTTYTVTGYNAAGCRDTATVRVTVSTNPTISVSPSNPTVCIGDTVTLTASNVGGGFGTVTYLWSPGGLTGNTIAVPVDSSITYTVVGTSSSGCSGANSIDSAVIVANASPVAASITASDTVVCGGPGTVQLSAGSASTYDVSWFTSSDSLGPWIPTSNQGGTITSDTISAVTYFYYVAACPSGLSDSSAVISINVSPDPIPVVTINTTQSYYCQDGTPVELIAGGATNYSWSPATSLSGTTTDTVYATPAVSTTYTVTGSDSYGCSSTITTRVSFRTNPVVSVSASSLTVCPGDSVLLTATATNITGFTTMSYTWEPGTLTGSSITVSVDSLTEYVVTGISNFGCSDTGSVDTIQLGVDPLPEAGFTFVQSYDTAFFTNTSIFSDTYAWDFGDSSTSGDTNTTHVFAYGSDYTVTLVATNGCGTDTFTTLVPVYLTGLDAAWNQDASVYPNPSSGLIRIDLKGVPEMLMVLDVNGKVVLVADTNLAARPLVVDLSKLPSGTYFLHSVIGGLVKVDRLVKY